MNFIGNAQQGGGQQNYVSPTILAIVTIQILPLHEHGRDVQEDHG